MWSTFLLKVNFKVALLLQRVAIPGFKMSRGKLSANVVSNVLYYAFSIVVNIFFTPYLIQHLGVSSFGIIPLATTVVTYLSVLTLVLNAGIGRYITLNLEKNNVEEAQKFFNTSLVSSAIFVIVVTPPCLYFTLHPQWFFQLPQGKEHPTVLLFMCTLAMFMSTVISSPFEVSTFCRNRFDIRNIIAIFSSIMRVAVVVLLFNVLKAEVWHVGIGILAATFFSFLGSLWAWNKLTPELAINIRQFNCITLKELTGTGGWIAISQIGTILLLSIDLLVVNRLFGPDAGGRYASLMQWSALLRGLGTAIAGVLAPTIIYYFARNEIDGMITYARQSVKFLGLFMALPVGLISGLAKPLLLVWLGPDFVPLAPLLVVMTVHLCLTLGFLPLHNISIATNNVRIPGLFQILIGILNLALAVFLAGPAGWGMYGVATAGAVVLIFRNIVFTPLYAAKIIGRHPGTFIGELYPVVFVGAFVTWSSWMISKYINLSSWLGLIGFGMLFACVYLPFIWIFFLNTFEKSTIKKLLKSIR